ncbi:MAG TPA: DUF1801 domain-containing protein [Saprospiraceae bacterium]|nr:DUF1801 domain-containing protein [Saprospiraceae bacterium]MBK8826523.1 DUF1801 domain-containing protein [Saprospiraceae bacterium]MBK9581492.1 DUF1801 domain-containing protein [Saprospiraceae bacterium]MBP6538953.1 DUF1801 domain-containing protein [Saprospiraceae bacterium]HQV65284.1 DUF1801 domain-containing protein [Saprospiraceae bacterium]
MNEIKYSSIDQYITEAPAEVKQILINIRSLISEKAPEAVSCIAYNMPAFKYNKKPLVYFAAFKNHIGFYALPSGNVAFQKELTKYKTGKGSIQFPLDQEIPYDLIGQIVEFRVAEMNDALSQKS